jgi:monofunctional biosynthetic peptidoglycan transglycosylase
MRPRGEARARPLRWLGWAAAIALSGLLLLQGWYFAQVLWYARVDPSTTSFMARELERLREQDPKAALTQRWVPYERISPHLKRAVIAAEDANFADHDGVDWDAIERAYEKNLTRGRIVRGGSTITMQLAKNLFLSGERSYLRKAQELAITFMIESAMDKRRILELYLNVAEWGVGIFGCEAAAQRYYKIGSAQLGPEQSARLAAMLPRPRFYDRNPQAPGLARRASIVRRGMGAVELP